MCPPIFIYYCRGLYIGHYLRHLLRHPVSGSFNRKQVDRVTPLSPFRPPSYFYLFCVVFVSAKISGGTSLDLYCRYLCVYIPVIGRRQVRRPTREWTTTSPEYITTETLRLFQSQSLPLTPLHRTPS